MKKAIGILTFFILCQVFLISGIIAQEKIKISTASDLPRRTYQLQGKALEVLEDREQLSRLADEILKNINEDLEKYEITDKSTIGLYYVILGNIYAYKKDLGSALKYQDQLREIETKESARAMIGVFWQSYAKALEETKDSASTAFHRSFEKHYSEVLKRIPYSLISKDITAQKGQIALQNREVIMGSLQSGLQPIIDKNNGIVSEGIIMSIISMRNNLDYLFPLKEERLRVLNALYEENNQNLKINNIWIERNVSLKNRKNLHPVKVGIWDSGTDVANLPLENRWVNEIERLNGQDDDGNGFVDDIYGIGYDMINLHKSVGTITDPAGRIKSDIKKLQRLVKGSIDLQSGIQSQEAVELQQIYSNLKRDQVKEFSEELSFYTSYSHGTHVAGIALEDNPAAKIIAARMMWSFQNPPPVPTLEKSRQTARIFGEVVDYFKKQGVRVVNMSWRYNSSSIEGALSANGIGKDAAERKKLAREMFEIEKNALYEAIKNAPEILFVCGSGNENNDADFSEYIPASFDLLNLVTVGAVNSEGKKTNFTTEGKSVDFYANGFEVESFVPGGDRMKMSGTSMASPQVANLAAKMLAVAPQLKVAELIELIRDGAEPSTEDPKIKLINPQKSFSLLKLRNVISDS